MDFQPPETADLANVQALNAAFLDALGPIAIVMIHGAPFTPDLQAPDHKSEWTLPMG